MSELFIKPYEISIWEDQLVKEYWSKYAFTYEDIEYAKNVNVPLDIAIAYCEATETKFDDAFNTIQYFDENRVAVIGSNTMDTPIRAMDPSLKRNVNGTVSLSFYLYLRYYDEETDAYKENPYVKELLVNERKLKLNYDGEWYDCIIKEADDDSQANTLTVTTADLFINELSKTGFNIEFDTSLGNNIGTVVELGEKVVEGTEWQIGNSDNFLERRSTNLYEIVLQSSLSAESLTDFDEVTGDPVSITIAAGETIYAYYPSVIDYENHESNQLQIVYDVNGNYEIDKDRNVLERIDNSELYTADEYLITPTEGSIDINEAEISYEFKGKMLIHGVSSVYDPITKKVVERYTYDDPDTKEAYMYYENKYYATSVVMNQLSNGEKFVNAEYWVPNPTGNTSVTHSISPSVQSPNWESTPIEKFHNFLRIGSLSSGSSSASGFINKDNVVLNEGLVSNLRDTKGFAKSDKYVFRISYGKQLLHNDGSSPAGPLIATAAGIKNIKIKDYKIGPDGGFVFGNNTYFNFNVDEQNWLNYNQDYNRFNLFSGTQFSQGVTYYEKNEAGEYVPTQDPTPDSTKKYYYPATEQPFIYVVAGCQSPLSYEKMLSGRRDYGQGDQNGWKIGVFIEFTKDGSYNYFIEEAQLFKFQQTKDAVDSSDYEHIVLPGMVPDTNVTRTYYYYEKPGEDVQSEEDVTWLYTGEEKQSNFTPILETGLNKFTKRRSITAKETNRFNLIQSLCETFECWAKFDVRRDENGKILKEYVEDDDGVNYEVRREKYIEFLEYIGKDNYAGFKYGINLKQVSRNIASDQIVTKLIVKDNSNEHAMNGFCSIARSQQNPSRSNFILNVDYYIRQGMLSNEQWIADLYSDTNGNLGYYKKLSTVKEDFDKLSIEKSEVERSLNNLISDQTLYTSALSEALESRALTLSRMYTLAKLKPEDKTPEQLVAFLKGNDWKNVQEASDLVTLYSIYTTNIASISPVLDSVNQAVEDAQARVDSIQEVFDAKRAEIEEIEAKFYKKYARYIQEGSWISEDYVDDTLYFLDGETVLYDSAFPRAQYNISVLELSGIEEYGRYKYTIGDKTFVEDTEFFGYYRKDGVMTPYQEEVVVTETVNFLDDPTKNTITVQNYKTQFEDLFQRITATTQSLQYSTGEYQRAASNFYADGSINPAILQNSIAQNYINLSNARNQSVTWGSDGITTTNLFNPLEVVRIVSGGIYISNDGGTTYQTGVSAGGINTNMLTAGTINADLINIFSGSFPTFSWDRRGINAYAFTNANVDYNKFVRHDQYGFYGIENQSIPRDWEPESLEDIEDIAKFGLLWNGFFLKSDDHGGMVKISSEDDIQVLDADDNERIKIGRLNDEEEDALYGIRISNADGDAVMETGDDGNLWLKNVLHVGDGTNSDVFIGFNLEDAYIPTKDTTRQLDKDYYYEEYDYTETQDTQRQIGKDYYYLVNNEYVLLGSDEPWDPEETYYERSEIPHYIKLPDGEPFSEGITYFEKTHEVINSNETFIVYENGQLVAQNADITGVINATDGVFNGTVYANSGLFRGTIYAESGEFIGDVSAGDNLIGPNGIAVYNGGLTVYKPDTYLVTTDENPVSGKTYYTYDKIDKYATTADTAPVPGKEYYYIVNDQYVKFTGTEFDPNTTYYEKEEVYEYVPHENLDHFETGVTYYELAEPTPVFYTDGTGNLVLSGNVYANDGSFTGTINARDGQLNKLEVIGRIHAGNLYLKSDGTIVSNCPISYEKLINPTSQIPSTGEDYYYWTEGKADTSEDPIPGKIYQVYNNTTHVFDSVIFSEGESFDPGIDYYQGEFILFNEDEFDSGVDYFQQVIGYPQEQGFRLDPNGNVYASNIELGTGAKIKQFLQVGKSAYLYNSQIRKSDIDENLYPDAYALYSDQQTVLAIANQQEGSTPIKTLEITANGQIALTGSGIMTVGQGTDNQIRINAGQSGEVPFIETANYPTSPQGWRIDGNEAVFNNITARGAIRSAVFEYSEIQAVGGTIIVRPSCIIKDFTYDENNDVYIFTLSSTAGFSVGDYCLFGSIAQYGNKGYKILSLDEGTKQVTFETLPTDEDFISEAKGLTVLSMGQGSESNPEIGLALHSTDRDILNGLSPKSLTVFSSYIREENNTRSLYTEPRIILGLLPQGIDILNDTGDSGIQLVKTGTYGLYAENVYLKGSLVSIGDITEEQVQKQISSGISSNSGIQFNTEGTGITNPGNVVLWAGAKKEAVQSWSDAIARAKFRVDDKGNLYAGSGFFDGTIITNSKISASEIETAIITGNGYNQENNTPALTIKDASQGIHFKGTTSGGISNLFALNANEIKTSLPFDSSEVIRATRVFGRTSSINSYSAALAENQIGFVKDAEGVEPNLNSAFEYYFNISEDEFFTLNKGANKILRATPQNIFVSATTEGNIDVTANRTTVNSKEISYNSELTYKQVSGGYDLYLTV